MSAHRVLIVAENVSASFGGEAFLPLHYFRVLRERKLEAWILTHERVREELMESFPNDRERLHFIPDTRAQVALFRLGEKLPRSLDEVTVGTIRQWITQRMLRARARELVRAHAITIVHQPTPVSPRRPSSLFDLGAPVVMGPMNGNMHFPPAFPTFRGPVQGAALSAGRAASEVANRLVPGKVRATTLLVANPRTRAGLPACVHHLPVHELVENGVDLSRFVPRAKEPPAYPALRFAFVGRLVDWKAVDLLLKALAQLSTDPPVELHLFGDGTERSRLEELADSLRLRDRVRFHGFRPQDQVARELDKMHALVLPSLFECGGAVVLEAMAKGLPVIATNWGGPADYLDERCGILVDPSGPDQLVRGLRDAMQKLVEDASLRRALGAAGRKKVERIYDWERKVDRMLEIYTQAQSA